ncbi:MAG: RNA polymerase factor sigma-54 [bacterium]|nr:RNA polymerase factor sigma-54 [bacterium]
MDQNLQPLQKQQLIFTPIFQQAMEILQLGTLQLVEKIKEELLENPVLEEVPNLEKTESFAEEKNLEIDWERYVEEEGESYNLDGIEERGSPDFEKFVCKKPTLRKFLLQQLYMTHLSEKELEIGELIIDKIDDNGYLMKDSIQEISNFIDVKPEAIEKLLFVIQNFEPIGVGARDLKESLLIQIKWLGLENTLLKRLVTHHLHDVQLKNYTQISRNLGISVSEVKKLIKGLQSLEPKPGRLYDYGETNYIIPDIIVEKGDTGFMVSLNDSFIPRLRISPYYKGLITKKLKDDVSVYIKERMGRALWFLRCLQQRRDNLLKVSEEIFSFQKGFLMDGPTALLPLRLKDVAEKVHLHEGTVSRIVSSKYAQTPFGVFKLKYFFSSSLKGRNGRISSRAVKEEIKDLITKELSPLSDQAICKILRSCGITISRRTVTKYREDLGILPSNLRKQ